MVSPIPNALVLLRVHSVDHSHVRLTLDTEIKFSACGILSIAFSPYPSQAISLPNAFKSFVDLKVAPPPLMVPFEIIRQVD